MAQQKSVTINGRQYDAVTGLPIEPVVVTTPDKKPIRKPAPAPVKKPLPTTSRGMSNSEIVHSSMQRSQTLQRRITKKPAAPNKPITKRSTPGRHMDIARSADITRFAKHPVVAPVAPKPVAAPTPAKPVAKAVKKVTKAAAKADKPARVHPMAQRALTRSVAKKVATVKANRPATAKEVKDAQIAKALATPTPAKPKAKTKKQVSLHQRRIRRALIIVGVIAVFCIALYAAWRLVPNISVSIAAAQAGIEATYPEYTPDGYSLSQPVTYSDGEVDLKFTSNSNDNYYTVTQTRSSWDSTAVLDNVVTPAAGANYVTTKERGLTIYTYDTSAAWVNGGILYKIDSKASLSGDQIRKIATSL